MKTLLAGPWEGEFGWMLMTWIPYCRFISKNYDRTVIVCAKQYNHLYSDFANQFVEYEEKGKPDRWLSDGKDPKMPKGIIEAFADATIKTPNQARCEAKNKRTYKPYGEKYYEYIYDIVIHARACTKYGQSKWNYKKENYVKMLDELNKKHGTLIACSIGTDAHHIEGTKDLRGDNVETLCNVIASSKVCVGTSSGAMHLASLCKTPHVVITDDSWQKSIKGTNKDRYYKIWNPLNTPCKVLDGDHWHPPVEKVVKAVGKFL